MSDDFVDARIYTLDYLECLYHHLHLRRRHHRSRSMMMAFDEQERKVIVAK